MLNNKIAITGAGGFIGKNLWKYFNQNQYPVIACVNKNTLIDNLTYHAIHHIPLPNPQFEDLIRSEQPAYLIHCLGSASVAESFINQQQDFFKNVQLTEYVLEILRKYSPHTKFVFLSSAAVYGNPTDLPIRTNTAKCPISPYGYHKMICETICEKYYRLFDMPIMIARIFSAYGPGLKKQLLWDIAQKANLDDCIQLNGTGNETRDFIYINDLAQMLHYSMEQAKFDASAINLATGQETTIRQIATELLNNIDPEKKLFFNGQTRTGDPVRWSVELDDPILAKNMQLTSLKDGIKHYSNWLNHEV